MPPRRFKRRTPKTPEAPRKPWLPPTEAEAIDIVSRASSLREVKLLARNIEDMGLFTDTVKEVARQRWYHLKTQSPERSTQ